MRISTSTLRQSFYVMIISSLIVGCTFSRTDIKNPEFAKDNATISGELRGIVKCETINIMGSQTTTNNKIITSQLSIEFVNPTTGDDNQNELGKQVARQLQADLKDTNEYGKYKVTFTKKTGYASVYKSFVFTKDEL